MCSYSQVRHLTDVDAREDRSRGHRQASGRRMSGAQASGFAFGEGCYDRKQALWVCGLAQPRWTVKEPIGIDEDSAVG